jgi:hypothetical protein
MFGPEPVAGRVFDLSEQPALRARNISSLRALFLAPRTVLHGLCRALSDART